MSIDTDLRPLEVSYDKSKGGYRVLRGSSPIHTAKTQGEAEEWMRHQEMELRVVRFFYNRLPPTLTPEERDKIKELTL